MDPYWTTIYLGSKGNFYPPRPIQVPSKTITEEEVGTILRSFNEVNGYHVHAIDGKLGHIEDIIIDDEDWQIIYVVIDTSNWLPWSKKVLIPVGFLKQIQYTNQEVEINLLKDSIENAPEYDPLVSISEHSERDIFNFFSISLVK